MAWIKTCFIGHYFEIMIYRMVAIFCRPFSLLDPVFLKYQIMSIWWLQVFYASYAKINAVVLI